LNRLPPAHREGRFQFFAREQIEALKLPQTDLEKIWPWFWQHRGGFFAAHYAQRLPQTWIRAFVIIVGSAMTVYFFVRAYL